MENENKTRFTFSLDFNTRVELVARIAKDETNKDKFTQEQIQKEILLDNVKFYVNENGVKFLLWKKNNDQVMAEIEEIKRARTYTSPFLEELFKDIDPLELKKTENTMILAAKIEDGLIYRGMSKKQLSLCLNIPLDKVEWMLSGTYLFTLNELWDIENLLAIELIKITR